MNEQSQSKFWFSVWETSKKAANEVAACEVHPASEETLSQPRRGQVIGGEDCSIAGALWCWIVVWITCLLLLLLLLLLWSSEINLLMMSLSRFICFSVGPSYWSFALYPTLLVVYFLKEFLEGIRDVNIIQRAAFFEEQSIFLGKSSGFFRWDVSLLGVLRR